MMMNEKSRSSFGRCYLCPRACGASREAGEVGVCRAGAQARVARAALHFWEEPPISGVAGSGTIFFTHCPLGCVYCQNRAISRTEAGKVVSVDDLAQMMIDLQGQGALNVNCVTPTHFAPAIRDAVRIARAHGLRLPIVWNTSGYETAEAVRNNRGIVDVYLTDFKYADAALGKRYSSVPDYPQVALGAIDAMVDALGAPAFDEYRGQRRMTRGVIVRHLLLPGHLDDSRRVVELLWTRYGEDVQLSLMNQYTPVLATAAVNGDAEAARILQRFPNLAEPVPHADYEELLDFTDSLGIPFYYWQQGGTAAESFIPDFS